MTKEGEVRDFEGFHNFLGGGDGLGLAGFDELVGSGRGGRENVSGDGKNFFALFESEGGGD